MQKMFSEDYYEEEDDKFKPDVSDLLSDGQEEDDEKDLFKQLSEKELAELHELDYEGVAGGQKTRFRYKRVPATSYGLTAAEILSIPDSLLNEFVSRKRFVTYRDEEWYVTNKQRRRFRRRVREVLETDADNRSNDKGESAAKEEEVNEEAYMDKPEESIVPAEASKKRKRKRKRRKKSTQFDAPSAPKSTANEANPTPPEDTVTSQKKKRKRKRKRKSVEA